MFPNKVRIGYYKQLDANGQFYKIDNNNEKRVYIYDKNKKEHMPFLNVYCDDVMIYNWTCSGLTLPVDYLLRNSCILETVFRFRHILIKEM